MDSGAVVYILFFLVIAVVQAIGQKKKEEQKKRQRASAPPGAEPGEAPGTAPGQRRREVRPSSGMARKEGSSEGMIPEEVWDEILGLARGKTEAPAPVDRTPVDPTPEALSPVPWEAQERRPESVEGRSISPPPEPSPTRRPERPRPPAPPRRSRPTTARSAVGQELFGDGSLGELRKAIILKEVLGPPIALRDEGG